MARINWKATRKKVADRCNIMKTYNRKNPATRKMMARRVKEGKDEDPYKPISR